MKKEGEIKNKKNYFIFVLIFVFLIVMITVGLFSGFFGKITGFAPATKGMSINITVGVPSIITVYNYSGATTLNGGPGLTNVTLNFTVYNSVGTAYLNDSTAKINLSYSGEVTRNSSGCYRAQTSTNYANYSCNITMWWFDGAGSWTVGTSIMDNNSNFVSNSSSVFYINANTGFDLSPGNLTWSSMGAGSTNQTANNPLLLNNTGNQPIGTGTVATTGNISINATNLKGETNSAYQLIASNFSVGLTSGAAGSCGGGTAGNLSTGVYVNVTSATLTKGNYTINDNSTGQENLYFCLRLAGSELISQQYSTLNQGAWTIKIG